MILEKISYIISRFKKKLRPPLPNGIPVPPFQSFLVQKQNGKLLFHDIDGYETRNESTMKLITLADNQYSFPDFSWTLVNTGDIPREHTWHGVRTLSYSTGDKDFSDTCPDFLFDHWKQVGISDYEETCREIEMNGDQTPAHESLGWRGSGEHIVPRALLVAQSDREIIDAEFIIWKKQNPFELKHYTLSETTQKRVSVPEHPLTWRYLIDVEGIGWSARLKLFMFSKRVVFIVERPYQEWFFPLLIPWVHYVPVRRDLSDLRENLERIKKDPELEQRIIQNALSFAHTHLTRQGALSRWNEIFSSDIKKNA